MITIPFIKMHGIGNDYVYIDCFQESTARVIGKTNLADLARRMSDRHKGIGADGIVLITPSQKAVAKMRIFNADGSEAQMCGNAIRCVGKYLYESGLCRRPRLFVETLAGIRTLAIQETNGIVQTVMVNMGTPHIQADALMRGNDPIGFTFVNMGNPHAVFFRDQRLSDKDLADYGKRVSTHPHFPEGTNVEFVCVHNEHELDVQVWERGTGVTLACGTGACAAAVAAMWHGWAGRDIIVHLPGGDLDIRWETNNESVYMTGPATEVFRGEYQMEG